MEYELSFFALLFFAAVMVYMFWGVYIIRLNAKSGTNKLFFLICISLSIWSLGFGMANSALEEEIALVWHRIAAIGWTTTYSLVLHFLLLLTNEEGTLNQKRLFRLIHIPTLISLYIFVISNRIAPLRYNLERIDYGWINRLSNTKWDLFFNIYYISFTMIGVILVWNWQRKLKNKIVAKRGQRIVQTIMLSFIIGSFTDRISSLVFENPFPQMAPLLILLPTWAMYHSARYYGVMTEEVVYTSDTIVTEEDRKNIFSHISIAFYMGSVLVFLAEYLSYRNVDNDLKPAIIKALIILSIGGAIRIIQNIKEEYLKEKLTIIVLLASIPIGFFLFYDYGAVTIWAFPMIIMISSIIFSKRTLLVSSAVISVISQTMIWMLLPQKTIVINSYDYIGRIGLFILAYLMGSYINRLYVSKIGENQYQIETQKINLELSSDFSNIKQENLDEKVNNMLAKIGEFYGADRACLCLINNEDNMMKCSHQWNNERIDIEMGLSKGSDFPISNWLKGLLEESKVEYLEDINQLPDEARLEREDLILKKVQSTIIATVEDNGIVYGFISLDSAVGYENLSQQKKEFLNIVSNILSSGISKIKAEKEIKFRAYYDGLTKLPNRFLFEKKVNEKIDLIKNTEKNIGIMFINLDNFKIVNNTVGHKCGDYLLEKVGLALSQLIGNRGIVARNSGDEFLIMWNKIEKKNDVLEMGNQVIDLFSETFPIQERNFMITASAGITLYPVDGKNADELLQNANIALDKAKELGRNRYVLSNKALKENIQRNLELSNDMHKALERDEFMLHYQPQVDLASGEINGLEALLRWIHPEKGMISPGIFIPLAEKNGLINSIGEWVLRTACAQNKKWQDMGLKKIPMAVNLSGVQFLDPHITNTIENILQEAGLEPKYLELEITESIAIEREIYAENVLNKLKNIGVLIAIDDFGTEYSSLSRLKILPIDRIKIDMQFIQGIEKSEKDRAIITVMINLAKKLDMTVIAEGTETKEQVDFLYGESCDDAQGYYYYKPMPSEEIEKILKDEY